MELSNEQGRAPSDEASISDRDTAASSPPKSLPVPPLVILKEGDHVGRYIVLTKLGQGGMGVVYSAYDPELDRKVAIKLVQLRTPESDDDGIGRVRLVREAQAMAKLSHPNVVSVFDVGTLGEQVFVAMELVEGSTLGRWLKTPRSWRDILGVYIQAGRGLGAAHAAGLIHRDFKPENVLMGADGRARVTDFGLVRRSDDIQPEPRSAGLSGAISAALSSPNAHSDSLTRAGTVLGTLRFMAPEHVLGQPADARSDQFSFCVALYEALYEQRPYATPNHKPGAQLQSAPEGTEVPAWVFRVLAKGLSLDAGQRYPSMDALLAALENDPVAARRRWIALTSAVSLGVAATAGIFYLSHRPAEVCRGGREKIAHVWKPENEQAIRAAFLASGDPAAEAIWSRLRPRLESYAQGWADMYREACQATRVSGQQSEHVLSLRMTCLDERLQAFASLEEMFASADAQVVKKALEAAVALPNLKGCADLSGLLARAPAPTEPAVVQKVSEVRKQLARVRGLDSADKFKESLSGGQAAVSAARDSGYGPVVSEALLQLGIAQLYAFRPAEAVTSFLDAFWSAESNRHDEVAARAAVDLLRTFATMAVDRKQADFWARQARASVARVGQSASLEGGLEFALGCMENVAGRFERGAEHCARAEAIFEKEGDLDLLGSSLICSAEALTTLGRFDEALNRGERSVAAFSKAFGPIHSGVGEAQAFRGLTLRRMGQYDRAIQELRTAADTLRRTGHSQQHMALAQAELASTFRQAGRWRDAIRESQNALVNASAGEAGGIDLQWSGTAHRVLCYAWAELGDPARAQEHCGEAMEAFVKLYGEKGYEVALSLEAAGALAMKQNNFAGALEHYRRAQAIADTLHPAADLGAALTGVGQASLGLKQAEAAIGLLEKALAIRQRYHAAPELIAETRFELARALWSGKSNRDRARQLAAEARTGFGTGGAWLAERAHQVDRWLEQPGAR